VPGIYIHSLLGSRNWNAGVAQTGHLRTINREKLALNAVETALDDPGSLRSLVFHPYQKLLKHRRAEKAFHPNGPQQVLRLHPSAVTLLRTSPGGDEHILAIHNVANQPITLDLTPVPLPNARVFRDLLSGRRIEPDSSIDLQPYDVLWLKAL
jgi:glucosylglycerate phosphorylase